MTRPAEGKTAVSETLRGKRKRDSFTDLNIRDTVKNDSAGDYIRELNCLYELSRLKNDPDCTLYNFLSRAVKLIPPGWSTPEAVSVRLIFNGREFLSELFRDGEIYQAADLVVRDESVGKIELIRSEPIPRETDDTRLYRERMLLEIIATEISTFIRFKQDDLQLQLTSNRLRAEQHLLEDKNTALREVLDQIEEEKRHIMRQVQTNVDRVIEPILRNLANKARPDDRHYIELLRASLSDVTSPFMSNLENRARTLSPREGEICNMIRNGMSSKEIAAALDVSVHTILKQRQRIRKKLGISNDRISLVAFLQTV